MAAEFLVPEDPMQHLFMFPTDIKSRKRWESALRREAFMASPSTRLCSQHFRKEDFDRTGQTVRIRDGVIPSVFNFPTHLQRPVATRRSLTSKKANTATSPSPSAYCSPPVAVAEPQNDLSLDHSYALPTCPAAMKARLSTALAKVESLEREKRNAKDRERRAKSALCGLLEDLRGNDLIDKELKKKAGLILSSPPAKTGPRIQQEGEGVCTPSTDTPLKTTVTRESLCT
ncbi:THAP domain-containing protein 6-like isoform X3 [Nerophis ophidion]|uniref:THAP domain-containing protein 6-like isoform X3 n=1 Tax=Nerophis ophidion TaxID=159077 RepID=UPI002ADF5BA5|nr:THAP domain-containing protein 6-like isoform X3 [Nerophis ophidion]